MKVKVVGEMTDFLLGGRKNIICLEGSRVLSIRPSVKSSMKMKALRGLEVVT